MQVNVLHLHAPATRSACCRSRAASSAPRRLGDFASAGLWHRDRCSLSYSAPYRGAWHRAQAPTGPACGRVRLGEVRRWQEESQRRRVLYLVLFAPSAPGSRPDASRGGWPRLVQPRRLATPWPARAAVECSGLTASGPAVERKRTHLLRRERPVLVGLHARLVLRGASAGRDSQEP